MRFTLQEAADGFKSNALKMQAAADEGDVVFDSSGRVSLMMAQSLARFVSREFSELFGANAQLPGRDVISMKATGDIHRIATPAGISLLEPDFCGILAGGTRHYQVEDGYEIHRIHALSENKELRRSLFVVRDTDTSTTQVLADAYMLGDARVQQAVRQIMSSTTTHVA